MQAIKLSEATADYRWVPFRCLDDDSADNYAPKTGLTFSAGELKIAKRGTAAASAANHASVVEAGNGWYWYPLSQGECDTLGPLMLIVAKTDVFADVALAQIVSYDPQDANGLGLSRLDTAVGSRLAEADYQDITAMLDEPDTIEVGMSLRGALRVIAAFAAGTLSGARTGTEYFRAAQSDVKVRITSSNDAAGNRTGVALDLSD